MSDLTSTITQDDSFGASLIKRYRTVSILLSVLDSKGFLLSPNHLVRLVRLLEILPPEADEVSLRNILCPIFATEKSEQADFYTIFNDLSALSEINPQPRNEDNRSETSLQQKIPEIPVPDQVSPSKVTSKDSFTIDSEKRTEPPYYWNISLPDSPSLVPYNDFNSTTIKLKGREFTGIEKIDWTKTVISSAKNAGVFSLVKSQTTRSVEYILLVEKYSKEDHRALLFNQVYQILKGRDVAIELYFHDGDIRVCFNRKYPEGIKLRKLQHIHGSARLIVLGNGYKMLSPVTGELANWTDALLCWPFRILLTPVSRPVWGDREIKLSKIFTLLPIAWKSFPFLANIVQSTSDFDHTEFIIDLEDKICEPSIKILSPVVPRLAKYFKDDICYWVAACAVWPSLNFNLTLSLAKLINPEFLTIENILSISKIDWFIKGVIPRKYRIELIMFLQLRNPELLKRVAEYLCIILEQNPPRNEKSVAFEDHQLCIAIFNSIASNNTNLDQLKELTVLKRLDKSSDLATIILPNFTEKIIENFPQTTSVKYESYGNMYDIYISYPHYNDIYFDNWIHVFIERLTDDYFSRVGRKPKIFLDKGDLRAGDTLNGKIAAALDQSLLFIPVLSPVYLSSEWCRKEFLYFMEKHKKRLVLDNSSRIVPLKFMPYEDYEPESAWASEVKTIMDFLEGKEILYKDFYRDLLPMPTNHADFMAEVANFSEDIKQLIKKLDSLIGIIDEVPSTPTIYLGYAFGEGTPARALREGLFREWEKQQKYGKFKHRILPDSAPNAADFPRNKSEAELREFIQQQLKQSDYAILVFDDVEGAKTTDTKVPIAHLQYQLALEESRRRSDFKVIVASQYSEDCASSQLAFIRQIEKDADTNECIRLVDGFEVKLIHNYLVDLTKEPSQPPTGDTRFAFYIYDSRDLEHQPYKTIKDIISQQGILPLSDSFREDVLNGPNDFFKKFWMISNYAIILLHHGETKFCFASLVDLIRVKADKQIPSHMAICVTDPDAQKRLKELYGSPYCEIIDCTQPNFEAQVVNFLKNTGHA